MSISIHALLAESDLIWRYLTPKALKFLSTLSLRRATQAGNVVNATISISIHALLAESDNSALVKLLLISSISIHALLAESDQLGAIGALVDLIFLSTLSLRRATR